MSVTTSVPILKEALYMAFILKSEENELFLIRSIRTSLFPFSCVFNTINDRLNIRLDLQKHEFIIYVTDDMICY